MDWREKMEYDNQQDILWNSLERKQQDDDEYDEDDDDDEYDDGDW